MNMRTDYRTPGHPPPIPQFGREGMLCGGDESGIKVAQVGNSEDLGFLNGAIVRNATVVQARGVDELGVQNSLSIMLQRAGVLGPGADPNETYACFARIEFGQGGTQHQVDVDCVNGTVINLPASFVRCTIFIEPSVTDQEIIYPIKAGAHIVYLPAGQRARPAQRTITAAIAGAGTVIIPIPRFAQTLQLTSDLLAATTFNVQLTKDPLGAVVVATEAALPTNREIPIANAARFAKITNLQGAALVAQAIFGLSL